MTSSSSRLVLLSDDAAAQQDCTLLNLCYGGMCFRTRRHVSGGEEHRFLLELRLPLRSSVWVKSRVVWVQPSEGDYCDVGAEFLESSKGWLGPDDED